MDGIGGSDGVVDGGRVGHIASRADDQILCSASIQDIEDRFHVRVLRAVKHRDGQLDVPADRDVIFVANRFGGLDVDVLVYRDTVGGALAHRFDVAGRIAADKEGREGFLVPKVAEDVRIRQGQKLFEVVAGDLGDQWVHQRDDIHARIDVHRRHLLGDRRTIAQQSDDEFRVVVEVQKQVGTAQMRSQGERSGDQAVKRGRFADLRFHFTHRPQNHR